MKRNYHWIIVLMMSLLAFSTNTGKAATLLVNTTSDNIIGSLRATISSASAGDTISFDGTLTNSIPILVTGGEIVIDKSLTIVGNGTLLTSIVGSNSRIFMITNAAAEVNISGLLLANGTTISDGGAIHADNSMLTINDCIFSNNTADLSGGGIYFSGDSLLVTSSQFLTNLAHGANANQGGAAIFNAGGYVAVSGNTVIRGNIADGAAGSGGGILNDAGATLSVMDSRIVSNTSMRAGGGIEDVSGAGTTVTLVNVALDSNLTSMSPGNGGGLHVTGAGDVSITGGTANYNTASAEGGALWNGAGTMTVSGMMIVGNTASGASADQGGGGLFNLSGTLMVSGNTVIRGNIADGAAGSGGGILNDAGATLSVMDSRIVSNTSMRAGGGIEDVSGAGTTVTLVNVALDSNLTSMSPGNGGGLHVTGAGDVSITGGTANYNTASAEGGALWNGAGTMTVSGMMIVGNTASGASPDQGGGGLFNLSGTLMVADNTVIRGNIADGAAGSGGGILNDAGATLSVTDSRIVSNTSMRAGGGIEDVSGAGTTVTLVNVALDSNLTSMSPGNGGGLHVTGAGDVSITGGTANYNTASAEGGALWNGAGTMTVSGMMIVGNTASGASADQGGGGLFNLSGTLMVSGNTVIRGNIADGAAGSGGGILNDAGATLSVMDSRIVSNTSMRAGGGIEDVSGAGTTVTLVNVALDSNLTSMSPGNGGGLHVTGAGDVSITGGTANNNIASNQGGGLWNGAGLMTITNLSVEGNQVSGSGDNSQGGGIYNKGGEIMISASTVAENMCMGDSARGGGIYNIPGAEVTVAYSTISGNEVDYQGGGVYSAGMLTLTSVTVAQNMATTAGGGIMVSGDANVSSSIIADNMGGTGLDLAANMGTYTSAGYNLIGQDDTEVFTAMSTDLEGTATVTIDPMLGPLQQNGGDTRTHSLMDGSPAIDQGDPADSNNDQRDSTVFNNRRDMGAYEKQDGSVSIFAGDFEAQFSIYPNPATATQLRITTPSGWNQEGEVSIYELGTGRLIQQSSISPAHTTVSLTTLAAGTYLLRITSDAHSESHRLVISGN